RVALELRAGQLLTAPRPTTLEEKVRRRLEKQQDHLFTFLEHADVDATHNLAERQLRPAVIARKVSCGNKTPQGARTWQILTSLAATCAQQSQSFAKLVSQSALLSTAR
ncbi:MAG TPA: transposase, partial [Verrucomicrobiae bacterium]